jgi:hypothetical protein
VFAIAIAVAAGFVAVGNAAAAELLPQGTEYEQGINRYPDI